MTNFDEYGQRQGSCNEGAELSIDVSADEQKMQPTNSSRRALADRMLSTAGVFNKFVTPVVHLRPHWHFRLCPDRHLERLKIILADLQSDLNGQRKEMWL